jgi:hypothetical protein
MIKLKRIIIKKIYFGKLYVKYRNNYNNQSLFTNNQHIFHDSEVK